LKNKQLDFRNDARRIASNFGTPTYVLYESLLKQNYKHFYNAFRENWDKVIVSYSVKTNYLPAVVSILNSIGASLEIVSEFELYLLLKVGISPRKIIFNGPCKTLKELEFAIKNGVFLINADSSSELENIDKVGKKQGKVIDVGIKVSTAETWKKFGIPLEYAEDVFKFSSQLKNIRVRGIHIHIGTNVSPGIYISTLEKLSALMRNLQEIGITINFLDIGGGFPCQGIGRWGNLYKNLIINVLSKRLRRYKLRFLAKYLESLKSEKPIFSDIPPVETYAKKICATLKKKVHEYNLPAPYLILEPGKIIVNSAGMLLVSVSEIKNYKEKWVLVDGGINLARSLESEVHRVMNVTNEEKKIETVKLAGPLCYGGDILAKNAKLPTVREGDIIEIFDIGAYNISQSMQFIKPRASVVLVQENGEMKEVRRREDYEDILRLDSPFFRTET